MAWPNLLLAATNARRRKRHRPTVRRFEFLRECELLRLRRDPLAGTFAPGPFVTHWVSRPKRRLISAAPYRDRVLHHAVMNVLEPILERHFHTHSFACRSGKGTHAASRHLQSLLRRFRFSHVRYCDDFILCDDDPGKLRHLMTAVPELLAGTAGYAGTAGHASTRAN